jgi:hypothetical protein
VGANLALNDIVKEQFTSMLREIVSCPEDPCNCFCSPKGCTAISKLARDRFSHEHLQRKIEALGVVGGSDATFRVVSDLLRLITFERLGMSHTCCKYIYAGGHPSRRADHIDAGTYRLLELMDPEVAELQEEDEYLSLLLEEQYRSMGISLGDFYRDHWLPRMAEVYAERAGLSPEDEDAIRDIGVVLHDTRDEAQPK